MFFYYGSKRSLAHLYPAPRHDLIVEPFAGSAAYALHGDNWKRDVLLLERDEEMAAAWSWLIDEATPSDLRELPDLRAGQSSSDLPAIVSALIGPTRPPAVTPSLVEEWAESRAAMAAAVGKVKHWQVRCAPYFDAPDVPATWFVDPPYEGDVGAAYHYGSGTLDFEHLGRWIRSRPGEVIACESGCARYLPFRPLRPGVDHRGDPHAEFVWYRDSDPA